MLEKSWAETIRLKRQAMFIRSTIWLVGAMSLWLGLSAPGVWVWIVVFRHPPPSGLFLRWYTGLGSLIVAPLGAIAPLAPMKGKDPEVIAADEFFHREP